MHVDALLTSNFNIFGNKRLKDVTKYAMAIIDVSKDSYALMSIGVELEWYLAGEAKRVGLFLTKCHEDSGSVRMLYT